MKFFYLSMFVALSLPLASQPVINNIGPSIGDSFTLNTNEQSYEPGPAGANQTYDFSSFTAQETFQYTVVNPDETDVGSSLYPESTSAWFSDFDGIATFYNFFDFTENIWREYGTYSGGGGFTFSSIYDDPLDRINAPINYGDSGSDSYSGTINAITSSTFSGDVSYNADGYGTLILPFATFENCLRVISINEESQDLGGGLSLETTYTEYIYFVQGYSLPIVYYTISESFFNGIPEETTYQMSVVSDYNGDPLLVENFSAKELRIYPNPATDQLTLVLSEAKSTVRLFDIHGKLVDSSVYFQNQQVDISVLPSGIYIVEAEGESGKIYRQKLIVQ